jgi:hypothetical protein
MDSTMGVVVEMPAEEGIIEPPAESLSPYCELSLHIRQTIHLQSRDLLYLVDAEDADVTFISSDNVIFKIHSKYIEAGSTEFPRPKKTNGGPSERVSLPEDSETLENLFGFMYPRKHPFLKKDSTPIGLLTKITEAAEKYQVFAAINICQIRMQSVLSSSTHHRKSSN